MNLTRARGQRLMVNVQRGGSGGGGSEQRWQGMRK